METATGRSRVLVVDEEPHVSGVMRHALSSEGYEVRSVGDCGNALALFSHWRPELVITELRMTPIGGAELCRRIRAASTAAIIVVSADGCERSKVVALDSGADDYVVKPFGSGELLARVRAALRRAAPAHGTGSLEAGDFRIDFDGRRVYASGGEVRLTPKEFALFTHLARRPNRVVPHAELLSAVWGGQWCDHHEYLRVFMRQLRLKLEDDPGTPRYLVTEPWIGYRFNPRGSS
jgi:two-component system, OmpR family, KDP operon response regulator KdpE